MGAMKSLKSALLAISLCLTSLSASALILTLEPAFQEAQPGDTVSVDLVASDLPPDAIGGFDIDIAYDLGALSFLGYTLGGTLGDILFEAIDFSFGDLGGVVNVAELSLLPTLELVALQAPPGPIVLAALDFMVDVLAPGNSTFLDIFPFSISSGDGIDLTPVTMNAGAEIHNTVTAVPEPTTLSLLGFGLAGIAWIRRRKLA